MRPVALVALLLSACRPDPDPTGPTATTAAPTDPLAEALATCVATGDEDDDALGPIDIQLFEYDGHGDLEHLAVDYTDDAAFHDLDLANQLGEPHQVDRAVLEVDGGIGSTTDNHWTDGHLVRVDEDDGSNGSYDAITVYTYDGDQVVHVDRDLDGDTVMDDGIDLVWTADGEGWTVAGTGTDPNGPYTLAETRDGALRLLTSHREDAAGTVVDAHVDGYSAIGLPGSSGSTATRDGATLSDRSDDVTFDELGRVGVVVHEEGVGTRIRRTLTMYYNCP